MTPGIASVSAAEPAAPVLSEEDRAQRVAAFVRQYYDFTWRCLRRFGLSSADADDAAQRVFVVAANRYDDIAQGAERSFLFRTAMHVASKLHRSARRRPESALDDEIEERDAAPPADELVDQRRARQVLDRILGELPEDLAGVIVLFEIEGLTTGEVAAALGVPRGTVASRLRRARAEIENRVARHFERAHSRGAAR